MKQAKCLGFLSRWMASLQSSSVAVSSAASYSESCDDGITQAFASLSLSPPDNNTSPASPSPRVLHRSMVRVLPAENSSSSSIKEDESNENTTAEPHIGPPSSVDRSAGMVSCSETTCEAALPAVSGFTVASVRSIAPASCNRRVSQLQTKRIRRAKFGMMGTIMEGIEVADFPVSACLRWSERNAERRKARVKLGMMGTIMEGRPWDPDSMTSSVMTTCST